jgi:hypothetical protein
MKRETLFDDTPLLTNDVQRFRWAIWFAQLNLASLWTQNWLSLQTELRDFLLSTHGDVEPGGLVVHPTDHPVPEEYTREHFAALQTDVNAVLQTVIQARQDTTSLTPLSVHVRLTSVPQRRDATGPERQVLVAEGATRDLVLMRLWGLLAKVNTASLLRCNECGTIFYKQRNQSLCSRTCVNRVSQRRWRERHHPAKAVSHSS